MPNTSAVPLHIKTGSSSSSSTSSSASSKPKVSSPKQPRLRGAGSGFRGGAGGSPSPLSPSLPSTATSLVNSMNFIFKSKSRTPAELVKNIRDAIRRLESSSASQEAQRKCSEDVSKNLSQMKAILYGDGENEPQAEQVAQLAQEVYNQDVLQLLVLNIWRFDFEAKKDVAQIFNNLLRRQIGSRWPTVEYLTTKPDVIFSTLKGYENQDVALNTGMILREMLRHEPLAKILLYAERFYAFPDYIEKTTFGVSCDAFANFKETLTKHKAMVAEYLEKNYDRFFTMYDGLLQSPNYVTKRQSLKLLGEILLDRTNFNVMTRYISSEENLKLMMNLLRDKSKNIQFEAFHVFKVFVANPKKPAVIENILRRNRDRLVQFLSNFHNDKDDEQFTDEKSYLISLLQQQPDATKVA